MSGEEEESSNSRIVERQEIEDAAAVEETHEEQERNAASVASHPDSTLVETTEAMSSSSTTSSSTTDSEGSRQRDEPDHNYHHPGENQTESLTLAPAREHTYLPGTSHPLFPENLLSQRRRHRNSSFVHTLDNDNQGKRNRTSQRQTGLKNDSHTSMSSTSCPAFEEEQKQQRPGFVELAILELRNVVLFPGSTIPIRLQNPAWIDYLGRKIDASRMLRGISSLESSAPDEEVRLGILTHVEETSTTSVRDSQRQRMSWARTGINRLQGQRLSLVLQQYLLDSDNDHEDASDDAERNEGYSADDSDEHMLRRRTNNGNNSSNNNSHEDANTRQDPVIGRIGTIATITYTHEADDDGDIVVDAVGDSQSRVWQSQRSRQIVVTALGTGRFRIVSRADDNRNTLLRLYEVEELDDEPLSYPSVCLSQRPVQSIPVSVSTSSPSSCYYMEHQERLIQNLAAVTAIPTFVYRMLWPWRMVGLIRLAMDDISDFEGLRNVLPSLDDSCSAGTAPLLLEPVHFSFWMASNMPFSQDEKLHLLKLLTPIERLRFIYKKVKRHQQESISTPNMLCCRWCGIPFASVSSMFTVGGAEGTTGAYGT